MCKTLLLHLPFPTFDLQQHIHPQAQLQQTTTQQPFNPNHTAEEADPQKPPNEADPNDATQQTEAPNQQTPPIHDSYR